jgi:hypothetical protein
MKLIFVLLKRPFRPGGVSKQLIGTIAFLEMPPKKYRTERQRLAAKNRQTRASERRHAHADQLNYAKRTGWQKSRESHKRSGYAAQKAWRARKRLEKIALEAAEAEEAARVAAASRPPATVAPRSQPVVSGIAATNPATVLPHPVASIVPRTISNPSPLPLPPLRPTYAP